MSASTQSSSLQGPLGAPSSNSHPSSSVIIGVSIGASVAGLNVVLLIVWLVMRRRRRRAAQHARIIRPSPAAASTSSFGNDRPTMRQVQSGTPSRTSPQHSSRPVSVSIGMPQPLQPKAHAHPRDGAVSPYSAAIAAGPRARPHSSYILGLAAPEPAAHSHSPSHHHAALHPPLPASAHDRRTPPSLPHSISTSSSSRRGPNSRPLSLDTASVYSSASAQHSRAGSLLPLSLPHILLPASLARSSQPALASGASSPVERPSSPSTTSTSRRKQAPPKHLLLREVHTADAGLPSPTPSSIVLSPIHEASLSGPSSSGPSSPRPDRSLDPEFERLATTASAYTAVQASTPLSSTFIPRPDTSTSSTLLLPSSSSQEQRESQEITKSPPPPPLPRKSSKRDRAARSRKRTSWRHDTPSSPDEPPVRGGKRQTGTSWVFRLP